MAASERRAIVVRGVVQGVGFRPFVFGLAERLGLGGFVRNAGARVEIEVEGAGAAIAAFARALRDEAPPLARVEAIAIVEVAVRSEPERGFAIVASVAGGDEVAIAADVATCADCVRELFDAGDRRHGHAFINCTNCGPRLTIIDGVPYDRAATTMAPFAMCAACRREYDDPRDRRFHAQPVACPACGPRLALREVVHPPDADVRDAADRSVVRNADGDAVVIAGIVDALAAGRIVAMKGLGGYHLACAADDARAVAKLRARKHRDGKPFAVLVDGMAMAERIAVLDDAARALLGSTAAPIVLVPRRVELAGVAPGTHLVGVMLPYTPIHHLVARAFARPIVLTSGNVADEPIAFADGDRRLAPLADAIATHDRAIFVGCDDSVARVIAGRATLVRRSRGYAPHAIALPHALAQPTLATGGHLKAVFALGDGARAMPSHHLGDLDDADAFAAYAHMVAHYERLLRIAPARIVHDAHPDYATTRYAESRAGIPAIAVQHHHAHFASCLADNGFTGRALGVILDGAGHGTDGTVWGGEIFLGDIAAVERVGHLRPVPLPGGTAAMREPWRMALAHLHDAGIRDFDALVGRMADGWMADGRMADGRMADGRHADGRIADPAMRGVMALLEDPRTMRTSSAGRLFDAAACLIAGVTHNTHEAAAAMRLEGLAAELAADDADAPPVELPVDDGVVDTRPLLRWLAGADARRHPQAAARRFHVGLAEGIARACATIARARAPEIQTVALSGGVFVNDVFTRALVARLARRGFTALRHVHVPPNDGGLALGQLAIVAARDHR